MDFHQRPAYIYDKTTREKMAELVELCEKSLDDDRLDSNELAQIVYFIENNAENIHAEPFYELVESLAKIINSSSDSKITETDLNDAKASILKYIDSKPKCLYDEVVKTNDSFFDNPMPDVIFKDKIFVLTGIFTIADRAKVAKMILDRGGITSQTVSGNINYLVVGEIASSAYINKNYGTKIEDALKLKQRYGKQIAIISEQHLIKFIKSDNVVCDVDVNNITKDVISSQHQEIKRLSKQKEVPESDRTFYGKVLCDDFVSFHIPFKIVYDHSSLGVIERDCILDVYHENKFRDYDGNWYHTHKIISITDKRNGNEVNPNELVYYIFKNLDDETIY